MSVDLGTRTSLDGRTGPSPSARDLVARSAPLDLTRVVVTAELVLGAVVIADRLVRRPASPRAQVVMGPGGWVSMKGGAMAVRPSERLWRRRRPAAARGRRPWWAVVLSARSLPTLS